MDFIFTDKPNELHFIDEVNKSEIIFIYREPNVDERIKYKSAMVTLWRDKEINEVEAEDLIKIHFRFGLEILTGFHMINVPVNISSDSESAEYREDWKDLIAKRAPELIALLAQSVFETGGFTPRKNS